MNLESIRDHIQTSTDLVEGTDLFRYSMPAGVANAVLLVTEQTGNFVEHEMPGIFKGRYQIIVRSSDFNGGLQRAYELFDLLNIRETDLGQMYVVYSRPRNTPIPIGGRSKGDLIEFSVNFDLRYRNA